jgi:DNA gyrase subunit B
LKLAKKSIEVKKKTASYGADSLREMKYPECVRTKIGMYLGSADEAGAYRAFKEIADNSFDEAMAGHGKKINIIYNTAKNLVTVIDQGRGLPMGKNKDGKFASEVALATLHGSGKFDAKNYAGGVIGTHGVGAACTNSVSEHFTVWSKNSGKWVTQRFERGVKVHDPKPEAPKSKIALKNDKGTVIQFRLDTQIFGSVVIEGERIHSEMRHIAMLNPGLSIVVDVDGEVKKYKSDNGLIDMIMTEESAKSTLGKPFSFQQKKVIDIAVCWRDDADTETFSYVNSSFTAQEGTHVQGARTAFLDILKGELSEKDKLDPKFFLKGMRLALNWRMENPIYAGQTKDRLSNTEVVTQVKKIITPAFAEFVKKNKGLISGLIERAKKFQANEENFLANNKAVKSIKLVDPTSRGILPGKLCQAHGYKPDEKELILVEGDSAEGSAKKARMPWQEILPLRGKIPNPIRTPFAKFMENEEVVGIFTALGCLPGDKYDSKKRRVGKVSFLPDADPDGKHINSELMALFTKYLPDWIHTGHTFYSNSPLFVGSLRGIKKFGNNHDEVFKQFSEKDKKHVIITRMKGWGEAMAADLNYIAMDPKTRSVVKLALTDSDEIVVGNIMGAEVSHRKEMLGIKGVA